MKDFRKALSTIPLTKPIFRLFHDKGYYSNTINAEPTNGNTHLVEETDGPDLKLAKELFKEEYDRNSKTFHVNYNSCVQALEEEIVAFLLRFLRAHSPQKNPKTTKVYKFTQTIKSLMRSEDAAAEAYYSVYKYLWTNQACDLEGTNVHVQNGLKILETLRNRFEKE